MSHNIGNPVIPLGNRQTRALATAAGIVSYLILENNRV